MSDATMGTTADVADNATGLDIDPRITQFVDRLARLEAGERARLKRNAGSTLAEARNALSLFYRVVPPNVPAYQHETYFLLATLYPLADAAKTGSFGNALRLAQQEQNNAGLDRRMEHILDADEAQLPFRLRQAVRYLYAQRVGVDWTRLLHDLLRWNHPERYIQRRWAADYFVRQGFSAEDEDASQE
jgi:CRISPR system Cascade subunit CasB